MVKTRFACVAGRYPVPMTTKMNMNAVADDVRLIWPDYRPTPLIELPQLAARCGVGRVLAKLENERPLGNFKGLGGMVAGLGALAKSAGLDDIGALLADPPARLPQLICASDGNHGLAVAAAAQRAGTSATIYLPAAVPTLRSDRIAALGGKIVWVDGSYDDAVDAALAAVAAHDGAILVADTTDRLDDPMVAKVMQGYGLIAREIGDQLNGAVPTHLFVQAGVGGLAAAMADGLLPMLRQRLSMVVVEPETAPCVSHALRHGAPVLARESLETAAEMLSCGLASAPAIATLLRHRASSLLVCEAMLDQAPGVLARASGPATTPSGAAGLAGLLHASVDDASRRRLRLDHTSTALLIITEGV